MIQVITLMWLRTTMNYQYRYGTGTKEAMSTLWKQGGIGRFYQGLPYALMQAPLARFGDTAANTGVLTLFAALAPGVPIGVRTGCASAAGSLWRILITPIDTLKTTMQVQGKEAMGQLSVKIKKEGLMVLYQGAIANAVASFVGSYPWYFTFNACAAAAAAAAPPTPHLPPPPTPHHPTTHAQPPHHAHAVPSIATNRLQEVVPAAPAGMVALKLLRNALCGFGATCVSDCISNVIRVLKTTVQTSEVTSEATGGRAPLSTPLLCLNRASKAARSERPAASPAQSPP